MGDEQMTDRAIRLELRRLKIPHGPITDSTRNTYLAAIKRKTLTAVSTASDGGEEKFKSAQKSRRATGVYKEVDKTIVPGLANSLPKDAVKRRNRRRITVASPEASYSEKSSRFEKEPFNHVEKTLKYKLADQTPYYSDTVKRSTPYSEYRYTEHIETVDDIDRNVLSVDNAFDRRATSLCDQAAKLMKNLTSASKLNRQPATFNRLATPQKKLESYFGGWNLSAQSSQSVLNGILLILFALASLYVVMSNQQYIQAVGISTAHAFLDTVTFVYRRMLLPLIALSLFAVIVGGAVLLRKNQLKRSKEERKQMFQLAQVITDYLKAHHEECSKLGMRDSSLPVPHIRDQLIPLHQRQAMAPVWKRTVEFLCENESRIRTLSKRIAGENFLIWQWLEISKPNNKWRGGSVDEIFSDCSLDRSQIFNESQRVRNAPVRSVVVVEADRVENDKHFNLYTGQYDTFKRMEE